MSNVVNELRHVPVEDLIEAQKRVIDAMMLLMKASLDRIDVSHADWEPTERKRLAAQFTAAFMVEYAGMLEQCGEEGEVAARTNSN
jgi:hypothetical protein